jgi:hypothetical protein
MQSSDELLISLYKKGVQVSVMNGRLQLRASIEALSPHDVVNLLDLKRDVIQLLERMDFSKKSVLKPRPVGVNVPLTHQQLLGCKDLSQQEGRRSIRFSSYAMRVVGRLDDVLLRICLDMLVQRHESLRTKIVLIDGVPAQRVDMLSDYDWEFVDLSAAALPDVELRRLAEEFVQVEIDISADPLFGVRLFRLSDHEHVLVLALDHIIIDGTSNQILVNELWTLYDQGKRGLPLSLPKLPIQFPDYACWLQHTYGAWLQTHEQYWRERLQNWRKARIPGRLDNVLEPTGSSLEISFGEALSTELRALARRENTLLSMVILSAFTVAMSRWCNQRDLVINFLSTGRYRAELQGMVGLLIEPLLLRVEIASGDNFIDLLKRIILEFRNAYRHSSAGWMSASEPWCNTEVEFNWIPSRRSRRVEAGEVEHLDGNDGKIEVREYALPRTAPINFLPVFYDSDNGVIARIMYRDDLFDASTVKQFVGALLLSASEFARNPLSQVGAVSMELAGAHGAMS